MSLHSLSASPDHPHTLRRRPFSAALRATSWQLSMLLMAGVKYGLTLGVPCALRQGNHKCQNRSVATHQALSTPNKLQPYQTPHGRARRSIGAGPTAVAHANRAMAALKTGDAAGAEADCSAALDLDPAYLKAWQRRAAARARLGRPLDAIDDLEAALRCARGAHGCCFLCCVCGWLRVRCLLRASVSPMAVVSDVARYMQNL